MVARSFIPGDELRGAFSDAMARMYRTEVPLYGELIEIVARVNARVLAEQPELAADLQRNGELERLNRERHGARRLLRPVGCGRSGPFDRFPPD